MTTANKGISCLLVDLCVEAANLQDIKCLTRPQHNIYISKWINAAVP